MNADNTCKYLIKNDDLIKTIDKQERLASYIRCLANLCAGNDEATANNLYELLEQAESIAFEVIELLAAMSLCQIHTGIDGHSGIRRDKEG